MLQLGRTGERGEPLVVNPELVFPTDRATIDLLYKGWEIY